MYENFFYGRLAQLRIAKNVSARDMSLSMGQSENYINMIENKRALPSMSIFFNICEYFNITPMDFFDAGNKNPKLLSEMVEDLKRVDSSLQPHLAAIIKELGSETHQPK